ncbi:D-alanyl-D-alanine carboxypeptidase (penicillin-binding protein 5/6) [Anaerobacterium chartisolvens]|uniref:D-alanyl-D-alanine carboxypeptidase (Penicillin-binding protein 5/6) n=1 Tax=Anaerobacterium chartisolvens TaxID=1297424 RepID=A0A369B6T7_9FIRM|nr:serine hydrolase [Anaerobacterium chartisolvens]RCX17242.1 D-alanyl-D-alanine carboxypeptidase (penicillin-binding protein 5/6) [Anaerobacterium chartisolvens]
MVRKVQKKKSGIRMFAGLLLMVVITAFVYKAVITPENHQIFEKEYNDRTALVHPPRIQPDPSVSISSDKLNSPNVILIRLNDYTVLMQKNSEEKIYPASLTKMMTAIAAIENLPDLKEEIKLTNSTFQGLYGADASMAGFQPGEQVGAIDLLYGVMLPSGAECCVALADQIAGSERDFVKIMNRKAADLGMDNTHFENTTGLHNVNHYTTVKDLAVLLRYALQNETFREIFTSSCHFTQPTNKHSGGITLNSTMFEELKHQNIINGEILGGKTGYTNEAGLCLASLAKVGKQEYILITAGAKGNPKSEKYNVTDALAVYNSLGE